MGKHLPLVSAALASTSSIPPLAFVLTARRERSDEQALLTPCVEVSLETHPALVAAWSSISSRPAASSFRVARKDLDTLLKPLCGGVVRVRSGSGWVTPSSNDEASRALGVPVTSLNTTHRPQTATGSEVRLTVSKNGVIVEVFSRVQVAGVKAPHGWHVTSTLSEAVLLVESLKNRVVLDGSSGAWASLYRLHSSAMVALPVPESPALATLHHGPTSQRLLTAPAAMEALAAASPAAVACHPLVADIASMAAMGPYKDEVLRPHQRRCVSAYMASRWGLLCALPPGSGKTVIAARILHHRASSGASLSLVCVPSQLVDQWREALATFHPSAKVVTDVTRIQTTVDGPLVVLLSYDSAASNASLLGRIGFDDMVVDEAHVMSTSSQRSRNIRSLRATVGRCLLLTGTPEEKGLNRLGKLVSIVLDQDVFSAVPLGDSHVAPWRDRVGPLCFEEDATSALPTLQRRIVGVSMAAEEERAVLLAEDAVREALSSIAAAESSDDKRRARLRLSNAHRRLYDTLGDPLPEGVSNKRAALLGIVRDNLPTVVCVKSASTATAVARFLTSSGVAASTISAADSPQKRTSVVRSLGSGLSVVVCSEVSSRGWDIPQACRVVHMDAPLSVGEELQRTSRARRVSSTNNSLDVVFICYENTHEHAAVLSLLKNE